MTLTKNPRLRRFKTRRTTFKKTPIRYVYRDLETYRDWLLIVGKLRHLVLSGRHADAIAHAVESNICQIFDAYGVLWPDAVAHHQRYLSELADVKAPEPEPDEEAAAEPVEEQDVAA